MTPLEDLTPISALKKSPGRVRTFGRITRVRNLGGIAFAQLSDSGDTVNLVSRKDLPAVRRGDLVAVEGTLMEHGGDVELSLTDIHFFSDLGPPQRTSPAMQAALDPVRNEALRLRGAALSSAYRFFFDRGFLNVQSPKIVGPWAVGQTGSFSTSFYGKTAHLSISNMIYHQMILASTSSRIFEIGPLFRAERPSSAKRLAEFTILDIGMAFVGLETLMSTVEALIADIHKAVSAVPRTEISVPREIAFERISYDDVLRLNGVQRTTGSQFPSLIKHWLSRSFNSFVWVIGFPQKTRPFFVRSEAGVCADCQLWYRGKQYIAAGGERETSPAVLREKILFEGKDPANYQFYLSSLAIGIPPMVGIGMGVERSLACWTEPLQTASFSFFPRYDGRLEP